MVVIHLPIGVREASVVIFRDVQNILEHGYQRTRNVVLGPLSVYGERPDGTFRALCALGWLLAVLFVTTSAGAQYRFDAWTADNGLPQNIIRGMHQTPDGYLWIATLDGVARFDGVHFTSSTKAIRPELPLTGSVQWWEDWAMTCGSCPKMAVSRGTTTAPSKLTEGSRDFRRTIPSGYGRTLESTGW